MIRLLILMIYAGILFFFQNNALCQQEDKLLELKKKIEQEKAAIEDLSKTEKSITLTLAQINEKIVMLKKRIKEIENNKIKLQADLNKLYAENKRLNEEIAKKRVEIEKRLILWHKTYLIKPTYSFTLELKYPLIFENYMRYIFNYDRILFATLKQNQEELTQNLQHIKNKQSEISAVEKELIQKKKEQEAFEKLQKERLTATKKEKAIHTKNLKNAEAALRRLEQVLKKVEQVPEYTGKGLAKGILPYPVAGTIVGHFGKEEAVTKGAVFARKGIEIQAREGAKVRAVDNGKVVYTGWIKNLGNICIISHGKHFYTIYGRLSSITRSKSDEVKQGEIIGTVGSEASFFDFPTLYFEIREGEKPLNPENWLR